MSWHYLRERGADFSLPNYLDGLRSQPARSMSIVGRSSLLVRPKDISSASLSGMTSSPSTGDLFGDLLMSLPEGSPARTSVQLVVEWALPASVAACGLSISDLLERLGLGLYSPKTSRCSVPVALAPSYQALPNWGMTYDGVCWELGMSARPIEETECGSSLCEGRNHHVPTPTTQDHIERESTSTETLNYETNKSVSLDRWAKQWPTPKAMDADRTSVMTQTRYNNRTGRKNLKSEVGNSLMWPTPGAQESQPTQEMIDEIKENQDKTHERLYLPGRKHHTQRTLSRAVQTWPTPTSSVGSGSRNTPGSKAHPGLSLDDAVRGDGGTGRGPRKPVIGTPTSMDSRGKGSKRSEAFRRDTAPTPAEFVEQFPTPTAGGGGGTSRSGDRQDETPSLQGMARKGTWPTPTARDRHTDKKLTRGANAVPGGTPLILAVQQKAAKDAELYPTPTSSMMTKGDMEQAKYSSSDPRRPSYEEANQMFPTPTSQDHKGRGAGSYDRHKGLDNHMKLFPTPNASDGNQGGTTQGNRKSPNLSITVHQQWPTPNARDHKDTGENTDYEKVAAKSKLAGAVQVWPTPAAHEGRLGYQDRTRGKKGSQKSLTTEIIDSEGGRQATTGQLNPTWVEWLMGWPLGWTDLKPLETDRFHWWLHKHGLF